MSLDDIFTKFNIDHPADFTGHSLSVSDVVVLHQDGEKHKPLCGFRWLQGDTGVYKRTFHIGGNQHEKMRSGRKQQKKMAEPDNDKVSYYVIEDLSTWAENSPEKSRLERFDSLPEAMAKFTEYRGKETEDKPDMARATRI